MGFAGGVERADVLSTSGRGVRPGRIRNGPIKEGQRIRVDEKALTSVFWSGPLKTGWLFENWIDARRDSGEIKAKGLKIYLFG